MIAVVAVRRTILRQLPNHVPTGRPPELEVLGEVVGEVLPKAFELGVRCSWRGGDHLMQVDGQSKRLHPRYTARLSILRRM
jgi:hypothetical protein